MSPKEKAKIIKDVSQLVLSRRTRMCNFLEYKGILDPLKLRMRIDLTHLETQKSSTVDMRPCISLLGVPPQTTS